MPNASRLSPSNLYGVFASYMSPEGRTRTMSDPSPSLVAVGAGSDVTVYNPPLRAVYVGGFGDVTVLGLNDAAPVTFKAVPVGTVLPVEISQVMATNTTATSLVGLR